MLSVACTCSYIKALLGGPTPAEYDTLQQETDDLRQQLESAKKQIEDLQASPVLTCSPMFTIPALC